MMTDAVQDRTGTAIMTRRERYSPASKRMALPALCCLALIFVLGSEALAQVTSLCELFPAGDGTASGRILQLIAVVTMLSVAPAC